MNYVSHKELFIDSVLADRYLELVACLISIFRFLYIPIKINLVYLFTEVLIHVIFIGGFFDEDVQEVGIF